MNIEKMILEKFEMYSSHVRMYGYDQDSGLLMEEICILVLDEDISDEFRRTIRRKILSR